MLKKSPRTYDGNGRLTAAVTGGLTTASTYDAAGNLLTTTDARNQTTSYTYDALNRPLSQSYGDTEILFRYDQGDHGIGRLSRITDSEGTVDFAYDELGRLVRETRVIGSASHVTGYSYSTAGDLAGMTYPSGMAVSYTRDATGRISGLAIDGENLISAITRLPFGPLTSATLGTVNLSRTYDQRYNLSRITTGSLDYRYTRDAAGHVTKIDGIQVPATASATITYSYNQDNNQLSEAAPKVYTHDATGNITSDGTTTFVYDGLNRLVQVERGGTAVAAYAYDSMNRRVRKTVGETTVLYLYDANSQLIAETAADGTVQREYVYLDGEPVALKEYQAHPGICYFVNDHLGTPQRLITATGEIVWQAAYLPFGKAQVTTATVQNNLRFPGQYFDVETGLQYNWNRYYDPETGRYISADPIGLDGGMNLYAYAGGNPVNLVDPWGLKPPVEPSRLPSQFRPESLDHRDVDMLEFRPGGDEDVKGTMLGNPDYSIYDLTRPEMTDAGNYNYGYAGAKNGYSYENLQDIADCDQYLTGKQGCTLCWPKDNPRDAENIREGYNDYHKKMKK